MKLKVKDAAELLQVSEKTIYRWISQEKLPMHQVSGQYRFNRAELLEWATVKRIPVSPKMMEEPEDAFIPSLEEALRSGGVYYRIEGNDKESVLRSVVDILSLPEGVDREFLFQVLARKGVSWLYRSRGWHRNPPCQKPYHPSCDKTAHGPLLS